MIFIFIKRVRSLVLIRLLSMFVSWVLVSVWELILMVSVWGLFWMLCGVSECVIFGGIWVRWF